METTKRPRITPTKPEIYVYNNNNNNKKLNKELKMMMMSYRNEIKMKLIQERELSSEFTDEETKETRGAGR